MQKSSPIIHTSVHLDRYRLHVNEHDLPYIELAEEPAPYTDLQVTANSAWPAISQMNQAAATVSFSYSRAPEPEYVQAARKRGERVFSLSLDERFTLWAGEQEIQRWAPFLADAMAIAAGYTSHGKNSRRLNRHGVSR